MATNQRNYFPIIAVAFAPLGFGINSHPTGYIAAHGVQSVGSSTNFNLENINELGQIETYEQVEGIPNVEMTVTKVVDGYPLIEHLASRNPGGSTLNGRYNSARSNVLMAIYNQNNNAASGLPLSVALMSGMYVSAINFSLPVQGNITESVTLVGNNKVWYSGSAAPTGILSFNSLFNVDSRFNNADAPPGAGGVQRRENIDMGQSLWPTDIPGISTSGTNDWDAGQNFNAHIQNVNISVNLGREELFEQGRRGPYYRFATFPVEVTTSIEVTTNEYGDGRNAYEEQDNLNNQEIYIAMTCGVVLDLGTKNKLTSITINGGDATGGNQLTSYNYSNFNSLTVTFPGRDFL